jgi:hypothetical protein
MKAWVADGGTLITLQNASAWAVQNELVKEKLLDDAQADGRQNHRPASPVQNNSSTRPVAQASFGQNATENNEKEAATQPKKSSVRVDYVNQQDVEGAKRINGAIFTADLDITNPLAFGITNRKLFINKNSNTFLQVSANKYATVAQYDEKPFVNGYSSKENISKVSNSAAIIVSQNGAGQVVLFADDPTYRSYWLGTNRIFLNSIFFANLATISPRVASAEESH